jgi:threonine aldolase
MKILRSFASDNNAGVHPRILDFLTSINTDHCIAYGDDPHTHKASKLIADQFGGNADVFFVWGGTGANVVAIQAALRSFEAVICAKSSHIHEDECGAPEKISGSKLLTIATDNGKITPDSIKPFLHSRGFEHHVQPRMVSITQVTEMGTLYSLDEIAALADFCRQQQMYLHVDGARIANAAVALGTDMKTMLTDTGVDIVSYGGTKNGLMFGEAVVFLNRDLAINAKYIRKQSMQLASKMRFLAAQFIPYIEEDLWRNNALHANAMAAVLAQKVSTIKSIELTQERQANALFPRLNKAIVAPLKDRYFFYMWDEDASVARWMTSFDTRQADIDDFIAFYQSLDQ